MKKTTQLTLESLITKRGSRSRSRSPAKRKPKQEEPRSATATNPTNQTKHEKSQPKQARVRSRSPARQTRSQSRSKSRSRSPAARGKRGRSPCNVRTRSRSPCRMVPVRPQFFCCRASRNPQRASLEDFKEAQGSRCERFRRHASNNCWDKVHAGHFDWYMFPIEDGSQRRYNVFAGDVEDLRADAQWLKRYREGVRLVAMAWGWDVEKKQNTEVKRGMGWTHWDVRLAKIIRSLWLFGQWDYMASMQQFARTVKPKGGLRYGSINLDEVFFMTQEQGEVQAAAREREAATHAAVSDGEDDGDWSD